MKMETFTNVWEVLGESREDAANLHPRAELMLAIKNHIKASGWTQKEAAKRLGVKQPRISELFNGKIDLFSIDQLVNFLSRLGLRVDMHIEKAAKAVGVAPIMLPRSAREGVGSCFGYPLAGDHCQNGLRPSPTEAPIPAPTPIREAYSQIVSRVIRTAMFLFRLEPPSLKGAICFIKFQQRLIRPADQNVARLADAKLVVAKRNWFLETPIPYRSPSSAG
jgi:predicted XRE-type DNA-binding protein